jgi:hypothetical protein
MLNEVLRKGYDDSPLSAPCPGSHILILLVIH